MPISSDRPDCFRLPAVDAAAIRTSPDQLHLVPPDSGADASAIIESHRRARAARGRRDARGCLVPIAGGLLLAAVAVTVVAVMRLPFRDAAIAVALLFVLGAIVTAIIASRRVPAAPVPKPMPSVLIHPRVAAGAPADLPARDLALASQVFDERDRAEADLRKARADAQLTEEERYVSPGDRSTWYYGPEDLPRLERTADDAERRSRDVASRLGIVLDADPA
ncbi:hypothetical protein [Microbacterium sp. CGR1]|uniref:hypothetical protein n=1 Tax=Microbacterium sp. CGR1 TaxID=1696072 RepID=UPI003DA46E53